jgi:hypothetical protein
VVIFVPDFLPLEDALHDLFCSRCGISLFTGEWERLLGASVIVQIQAGANICT